ncbi:MAG: winged helix-turn-helix domain-containing protein [Candidatus Bathyarchaeota archaeon]|nr:winged helix-turn-helix domain-containing protein [Candidatus Bathyarchaeota archaeon]
MSRVSELFEKISHPTRVKILKLLKASPLSFSQLKNNLGIESSGNVDHHLKKLGDLIYLDSDGLYKISDEGKEAMRAIKSIESSFAVKETYPVAQSRRIFGVLLMLLAIFTFAVTIMAVAVIPESMTSQQLIGLLGGLIGSIVGMLGATLGLKGAIMADGKSSRHVTYFPSRKDPWMTRNWFANLLFFGSYLTLLFSLIYAQMSSTNFLYKPLWFTASNFALSTLFITSIVISYRIIEKANRKIERSVAHNE